MSNASVTLLLVLLCSGVSLAQNPVDQLQPEQPRLVASKSDLMARSEMQAPRAIPVVKQLRFQEIPVSIQLDNPLPVTVHSSDGHSRPATAGSIHEVERTSQQFAGTPAIELR